MKVVTNKYSGAFVILLNLNVFFFQSKLSVIWEVFSDLRLSQACVLKDVS